ncbi:uncharacterized protein B0H18DRAFT_1210383 [Fomitopsis serialis]|uniref:uncharacterized protein n=1 Tax=Fomitopsis serialis TaxID=139415 RepID=UPI002007674B|nr:uncharacterized protein B0H18DRAFT_1210383 [Neoantrodia serialis]KAH9928080.1 hypothetical protein B0H18DRAFT_1210383 [Neoantrodia serialis]
MIRLNARPIIQSRGRSEASEEQRLRFEEIAKQQEEERIRSEEARRRAEEQSKRAEADRSAAEEQRRQAEADARRADEERARAEAEAHRSQQEQQKADLARQEAEKAAADAKTAREKAEKDCAMASARSSSLLGLSFARLSCAYSTGGPLPLRSCWHRRQRKSSLMNAFRGLRNKERARHPWASSRYADIARYPDPTPVARLCGTTSRRWHTVIPDWQYFTDQGLYIFDCIIVLFDNRFTATDQAILRNCARFQIPTYMSVPSPSSTS